MSPSQNFETEVIAASMTHARADRLLGALVRPLQVARARSWKSSKSTTQGRFTLVKIDSDQEQQLAQAFGIRSIPTCMLMMGGKPVDGFMGALPEGKLRRVSGQAPAQRR